MFHHVQKIFFPSLLETLAKFLLALQYFPQWLLFNLVTSSDDTILSGREGCELTTRCIKFPRGLGTNIPSSYPISCLVAQTQQTCQVLTHTHAGTHTHTRTHTHTQPEAFQNVWIWLEMILFNKQSTWMNRHLHIWTPQHDALFIRQYLETYV